MDIPSNLSRTPSSVKLPDIKSPRDNEKHDQDMESFVPPGRKASISGQEQGKGRRGSRYLRMAPSKSVNNISSLVQATQPLPLKSEPPKGPSPRERRRSLQIATVPPSRPILDSPSPPFMPRKVDHEMGHQDPKKMRRSQSLYDGSSMGLSPPNGLGRLSESLPGSTPKTSPIVDTGELARLWKENETLKVKLKDQSTMIRQLQKQLTAMMAASGGGSTDNAMIAKAGNQLLHKLQTEGCFFVWDAVFPYSCVSTGALQQAAAMLEILTEVFLQHSLRCRKSRFHLWADTVKEIRHDANPIMMAKLRELYQSMEGVAFRRCFREWDDRVREKRRLRSNPFLKVHLPACSNVLSGSCSHIGPAHGTLSCSRVCF